MVATEVERSNLVRSQMPLIIIGVLWLALGGFLFYTQFSAARPITVEWVTETEYDTAGFNIYRSETIDGDYVQINPQLIPSQADPASGARYEFIDANIEPGKTYFYKLEDVEYSNTRQQHDVIQGDAPKIETWALILAAVSLVLGVALITTGIKGATNL